jgi:TPR repeat protein
VQPYRDADGNVFDIAEEDVADFMAASPGAKPDLKLRMPNDEKIVVPIDEVYNFLNAYKSDPDAAIERYLSKVEKFRKAAEQGNALAQYNLGCCYLSGEGVKEDLVQAVAWFRKAAEQGNALAQSLLMIYYRDGTGGVKKYSAEAVAWYHKAAEQGYADAQYLLGQCYANGEGVKKDPVQAVAWYRKAAEQGDADAQDMLGQCYANGEGVKKDPVQAVAWYRKAAERRDVYAQASFRFQHYMAEQGDASAQYLLGQCYANGNGVKTNLVQAAAWYRKAADQGDPGAQGRLGQCYDYGDGVTANPVQAATWYQKAAEQGYAYAQYRLGLCYEKGRGVVQNDIQACVHHLIASALGFDESSRNLKGLLDDRLSAKDYAAAQRVATEWMERFHARAKKGAPQTPESMTARRGDKPRGTGSGFVISMDGYFLTCAHVIEGGREIKVRIGDKTHPAKVVRADNRNDVALLKLEGSDFRPLSLSQSPPDMGDKVFTVGFPNPEIQGASAKYTDGAISALSGILDDIRTMQVTVPIQGGNSGGALADAAGNVVGLVVAQLNAVTVFEYTGAIPQNVNFAVKINYAFPLIQAVPGLSSRLPQQAKAGASASPVKAVEAATGLVVVYE